MSCNTPCFQFQLYYYRTTKFFRMENRDRDFEIARIIAKEKITGLTDDETKILTTWLDSEEAHKRIYRSLSDPEHLGEDIIRFNAYDSRQAFRKIRTRHAKTTKIHLLRRIPAAYKIAASIAVILTAAYIIFTAINTRYPGTINSNNIQPGTHKALLITSDNRQIELGRTTRKSIIRQHHTTIVDTSSTLIFRPDSVNASAIEEYPAEFNTLIVPAGGEYSLVLPDGSKVKLNSLSTLKFPVVFAMHSRVVELTGEGYFEVAKSGNTPFAVKMNGLKTTVYGTSFNISAYPDDGFIKTTLVSGSIGIEMLHDKSTTELKLEPGQQASFDKKSNQMVTKKVNTRLFTSWTQGLFIFENEPLESILHKLSRWYDFEVEFKDDALRSEPFTGDLKRYDTISKIIDMISIASTIKFKIVGKKIIVFSEK